MAKGATNAANSAMPNINLIAERREEQLRLVRMTRQLFLALSCSVAVFACLVLFLAAQRMTTTGELQDTEAKMANLQPVLDSIARIQKDTAALQPKVDTLSAAKDGTTKWRVVLQAIAESIPDDTYLTTTNSGGTVDDTTISMTGISSSQTVVGDMMTRLNSHPLFDRVDLHYTQAAVLGGSGLSAEAAGSAVQFEIAAHLKGTPKPEPPKTADKKDDKSNG